MSFVVTTPDVLAAAVREVAGIGSTIAAAHTDAAAATTALATAGADDVSVAIATLFGAHGRAYQALSTQAAAFHNEFVQTLNSAGSWYASAEAANASPVQSVEQEISAAVNAPTVALIGRPLIGNGANGTAADPNGHPGGILYGSGGGSAGLIGNGGAGGTGYSNPSGAGTAGGTGGTGGDGGTSTDGGAHGAGGDAGTAGFGGLGGELLGKPGTPGAPP